MPNYSREFYDDQSSGSAKSAQAVLPIILHLIRARSIVDIGCGVGTWLRVAKQLGVPAIAGVDGKYVQKDQLQIEPESFFPLDLETTRIALLREKLPVTRFDMAMSLEVAEHLSYERAATFVEDMVSLSDVILFAAAVPFQGGENHVNEQWPEFWKILFEKNGYRCYDILRDRVWNHPDVEWWYAQNTFLYVKQGSAIEHAIGAEPTRGPLSRVHPRNYLSQILVWFRRHRFKAESEEVGDYVALSRASESGAKELPRSLAVERAKAHPGARDVFPYTRMEVSQPERELELLREQIESLQHLAVMHQVPSRRRESPLTLRLPGVESVEIQKDFGNGLSLVAQNRILLRCVERLSIALERVEERGRRRPSRIKHRLKRLGYKLAGRKDKLTAHDQRAQQYICENNAVTSILDVAEMVGVHGADRGGMDVARSQSAWSRFVEAEGSQYLKSLSAHEHSSGPLRIFMLIGGGGLGDVLMMTPLISALKEKFSPCEIVVGYEPVIVKEVLDRNPDVSHVISMNWGKMHDAAEALRDLSIFDLVVYVRCFIPYLISCRDSRVSRIDQKLSLQVNAEVAERMLPYNSNLGVSILDAELGLHYLDMLGIWTALPISRVSPLRFYPNPSAKSQVDRFGLAPKTFVTIRDGSSPGDVKVARMNGVNRTTKQMPVHKWVELVKCLRALGIDTVQVGASDEPMIPGVSHDLRGRTSLSELFYLMQNGVAHVDTEGGLVHFANAASVPCVAFYGPTSVKFFGYPQNLNVSSERCNRCWYSHDAWLYSCMQDGRNPPCFSGIDMADIARKIASMAGTESEEGAGSTTSTLHDLDI